MKEWNVLLLQPNDRRAALYTYCYKAGRHISIWRADHVPIDVALASYSKALPRISMFQRNSPQILEIGMNRTINRADLCRCGRSGACALLIPNPCDVF